MPARSPAHHCIGQLAYKIYVYTNTLYRQQRGMTRVPRERRSRQYNNRSERYAIANEWMCMCAMISINSIDRRSNYWNWTVFCSLLLLWLLPIVQVNRSCNVGLLFFAHKLFDCCRAYYYVLVLPPVFPSRRSPSPPPPLPSSSSSNPMRVH